MKISHHHIYFTLCCHFLRKRTCKALKQCYLLNLSGVEPHKLRWSHSAYPPDVLLFRALCPVSSTVPTRTFFFSPQTHFHKLLFASIHNFTDMYHVCRNNASLHTHTTKAMPRHSSEQMTIQLTLAQASSGILAEAAKRVAELRVCTGRCSIKWRAAGARWTLWPCPAAPDTSMRGRNTIGKLLLILSQNKTKWQVKFNNGRKKKGLSHYVVWEYG